MPNILKELFGTLSRNKKKSVVKVQFGCEGNENIAALSQEKTAESLSGLEELIITMPWEFVIKAANKRVLDELPDNITFRCVFSNPKNPDINSMVSLQALKKEINKLSLACFKALMNYLNDLPEGSLPQIKQKQYASIAYHLEKLGQNLLQKLALNQDDTCYVDTISGSRREAIESILNASGSSDDSGFGDSCDEHIYEEILEDDAPKENYYEVIPGEEADLAASTDSGCKADENGYLLPKHFNPHSFFPRVATAGSSNDYVAMSNEQRNVKGGEGDYLPMTIRHK
jgi:hypothetical protein